MPQGQPQQTRAAPGPGPPPPPGQDGAQARVLQIRASGWAWYPDVGGLGRAPGAWPWGLPGVAMGWAPLWPLGQLSVFPDWCSHLAPSPLTVTSWHQLLRGPDLTHFQECLSRILPAVPGKAGDRGVVGARSLSCVSLTPTPSLCWPWGPGCWGDGEGAQHQAERRHPEGQASAPSSLPGLGSGRADTGGGGLPAWPPSLGLRGSWVLRRAGVACVGPPRGTGRAGVALPWGALWPLISLGSSWHHRDLDRDHQ